MFRNTALSQTPTYKLILGFGLCTLGGAMLYAYFKTRDDDEEEQQQNDKFAGVKSKPAVAVEKVTKQAQKEVKIEMKIANEHVPLVAGRQSANLKFIENKTLTKIHFRDKDDSNQICEISGYSDNVKEARSMILKEIERAPTVQEEIYVDQMAFYSDAIQEICRISLAKVSLDAEVLADNTKRITITGNRHQVNIARKLIQDKIEEYESLRKSINESEQKREPRRSPVNSVNSSNYSSQTSLSSLMPMREKVMAARNDEKPLEVYVSAVASPSKFWIQLIGPQIKKLDDLVADMTDYYSVEENRVKHQLQCDQLHLGQIVAAIFRHDNNWYRAEIVGILPNHYNSNESYFDLYFVDYGDSVYTLASEVFELRTDFLSLRFQAVECFLAYIGPTAGNDPDTWDQHAIEAFEEYTQVARWKKLFARVVTYKDRVKSSTGYAAEREGAPVPGVELYEIREGEDLDLYVGDLMIERGEACDTMYD